MNLNNKDFINYAFIIYFIVFITVLPAIILLLINYFTTKIELTKVNRMEYLTYKNV